MTALDSILVGWNEIIQNDMLQGKVREYLTLGTEFLTKADAFDVAVADTTNNFCAVGNDPSSNNATGFSILPAGEFSQRTVPRDLTYAGFSTYALLWSSTESTATSFAIWLILRNSSAGITPFNWGTLDKYIGGSVRCVRD